MANIINHWGLCVTDIPRAERFYIGAFGFVKDRELRLTSAQIDALMLLEPKSDIYAVYLILDGQTLELMHFTGSKETAGGRAFNQTGMTHFSISVDDIPGTIARCLELGGTLISKLALGAVVRDPEGQLVEILPMSYHTELQRKR